LRNGRRSTKYPASASLWYRDTLTIFYPSPKYFYIHHPERHEICSIIQPRVNVPLFAWMNHPLFFDAYKYTYSQNYLLISPLKRRCIDDLSLTTDSQDEEVSKTLGYRHLFAMCTTFFLVSWLRRLRGSSSRSSRPSCPNSEKTSSAWTSEKSKVGHIPCFYSKYGNVYSSSPNSSICWTLQIKSRVMVQGKVVGQEPLQAFAQLPFL